jgi:hypothetical protein
MTSHRKPQPRQFTHRPAGLPARALGALILGIPLLAAAVTALVTGIS